MSTTNLIPFGAGANVPAYLQNNTAHSTLDDQAVGASVDKITQKDGWIIVDEAGVQSAPMMSIDVVVLDAQPRGRETYRAYYEGLWKEGESTAPVCYSNDGKAPSPHCEKPQATTCANCPMNVTGSGPNGEGRACGFFKHVAVTPYPQMDKIYRLKVSSRSLFSKEQQGVPSPLGGNAWGFGQFAKLLQQMKTPWESVVTRVSLPKGQTYGFFFTPTGYATEDEYRKALDMQKDPAMADILTAELSASMATETTSAPQNFLPPPPTTGTALPPPVLSGREKWLASTTLPQNVKDWIAQVDDATAQNYLATNFPTEV